MYRPTSTFGLVVAVTLLPEKKKIYTMPEAQVLLKRIQIAVETKRFTILTSN